jgi:hypothetical protein
LGCAIQRQLDEQVKRSLGTEVMADEYEIENSPLSQRITKDNVTVEVCIYRGKDEEGWLLEVVDQEGGSTIWDDRFATEQAALQEAMDTIAAEGIASFMLKDTDTFH